MMTGGAKFLLELYKNDAYLVVIMFQQELGVLSFSIIENHAPAVVMM